MSELEKKITLMASSIMLGFSTTIILGSLSSIATNYSLPLFFVTTMLFTVAFLIPKER